MSIGEGRQRVGKLLALIHMLDAPRGDVADEIAGSSHLGLRRDRPSEVAIPAAMPSPPARNISAKRGKRMAEDGGEHRA